MPILLRSWEEAIEMGGVRDREWWVHKRRCRKWALLASADSLHVNHSSLPSFNSIETSSVRCVFFQPVEDIAQLHNT